MHKQRRKLIPYGVGPLVPGATHPELVGKGAAKWVCSDSGGIVAMRGYAKHMYPFVIHVLGRTSSTFSLDADMPGT